MTSPHKKWYHGIAFRDWGESPKNEVQGKQKYEKVWETIGGDLGMLQIIKRDGTKADFTLSKINDAIMKAFNATEMSYNNDIVDLLALRVTADFQSKIKDNAVQIEDVQDSVEKVLGQAGYEEVAKAYILYRRQREKMRAMKSTILDYKDVVNSYVKVEDWRVKENSTVT